MECGIAGLGKLGASTWDWAFGGQTPPTGCEAGLRAGRPWSVAREILRPGDASAVPRCSDQRGHESALGWGHDCHQNLLGLSGNRCGAGLRCTLRRSAGGGA